MPPGVEASPASILTQVQSLPLTNPDIKGYAIRLSSASIFRPVAVGLGADGTPYSPFEHRFYRTLMCR